MKLKLVLYQFSRFLRSSFRRVEPAPASATHVQQEPDLGFLEERDNMSNNGSDTDSIYAGPFIIISQADIPNNDSFLNDFAKYMTIQEKPIFSSILKEDDYYVLGLTDRVSVLIADIIAVFKKHILLPAETLVKYEKVWNQENTAPLIPHHFSIKKA